MSDGPATLTATLPGVRARVSAGWLRPVWEYREAMLVFVALIVVWEFLARYVATAPNSLLPGPAKVVVALRDALPELWRGTVASLLILVPGFALATVLGVLLGLRVATSERSRRAFLPFVRVAAPVPPTVHIPYAIAVLPTFRTSAIFVVFIGAFWPIFINALGGAHSLDARYRDNARILGLGVAELFGANAGLGRFVQDYADFADYPKMVGGILYTGLVTFLAMTLLDWARRRALFWLR